MGVVAGERGTSLVEAVVATATMAGVLMLAVQWVADGAQAASRVFGEAAGSALAAQKLEQLRALRFSAGADRDLETDTTVDPPAPAGGVGLTPSPPGSLDADVTGYVDYLAHDGRNVGQSAAVFVRRWAIESLPLPGGDGLLIEVCVSRRGAGAVCKAAVRTQGTQ